MLVCVCVWCFLKEGQFPSDPHQQCQLSEKTEVRWSTLCLQGHRLDLSVRVMLRHLSLSLAHTNKDALSASSTHRQRVNSAREHTVLQLCRARRDAFHHSGCRDMTNLTATGLRKRWKGKRGEKKTLRRTSSTGEQEGGVSHSHSWWLCHSPTPNLGQLQEDKHLCVCTCLYEHTIHETLM